MKRVLYVITSPAHKRVFEPFTPRDDMHQMIVGPTPPTIKRTVPEDYSDFQLPVTTYKNLKEIQAIVNGFNPNIYVQADLIPFHRTIKLPDGCKKVYVSHGMVGNHVLNMVKNKQINGDLSVWKGFDLYCGAGEEFKQFVMAVAGVSEDKILLNALPQLDVIYNYRQKGII